MGNEMEMGVTNWRFLGMEYQMGHGIDLDLDMDRIGLGKLIFIYLSLGVQCVVCVIPKRGRRERIILF